MDHQQLFEREKMDGQQKGPKERDQLTRWIEFT
jgi:hypothetical protein